MILSTWKGWHWRIKALVVLSFLFALYVVLGFWAVPPLAQSILTEKLGQLLSRRVTVESVAFNPLALRAKVQGTRVYGTDNSTVDLSLGLLDVDMQASSLFRGAVVLRRVAVKEPSVFFRILTASGQTNLADIFSSRSKNQSDSATPTQQHSSLFPVIIEDFSCTNGSLRVQDDPRGITQVIDHIGLTLPYLSTKKKDFQTKILPHLAFRLNKTLFEIQGSSLPFVSPRRTTFDLSETGLNLTAFWKYLYPGTKIHLVAGQVTSKVVLVVEESDGNDEYPLQVFLSGRLELDNAKIRHQGDGNILGCKKMLAELDAFSLVHRSMAFSRIHLQEPFALLIREKDNVLNWNRYMQEIFGTDHSQKDKDVPPLRISAKSILVEDGQLMFKDAVVNKGFTTTLSPLNISINNLDTQGKEAAEIIMDTAATHGEHLACTSHMLLSPFACNGTVRLTNASIPAYAPYYSDYLPLEVDKATLGCASIFELKTGDTTHFTLSDLELCLDGLQLRQPDVKTSCLACDTLSLAGGEMSLDKQIVQFANATLLSPFVSLERDKQGRLDVLTLFAKDGKKLDENALAAQDQNASGTISRLQQATEIQPLHNASEKVGASVSQLSSSESKSWLVAFRHVACVGGEVSFTDHTPKQKTVNKLHNLNCDCFNLTSDPEQSITFRVNTRINHNGTMKAQGNIIPQPLITKGQLDLHDFVLASLNPYLPPPMQIDIAGGLLNMAGEWELEGADEPRGTILGDVQLADVLVREGDNKKKLADLACLDVQGLILRLAPYGLHMEGIRLSDPHLFLEKDEKGRLNLVRALRGDEKKVEAASSDKAGKSEKDTSANPYFFKEIHINKVQVTQGKVDFHDHSLSPDFTADVAKINLAIDQISLDPTKMAQLNLNATLNDHAPISLTGDISPLREPLASDLMFKLSHLNMSNLTPYSIKTLAYPIKQGKLNWNGKFTTDKNVLDASNTFFVQQLELGEKVKSPDAVNIPITLGLALLQDSDGDLTLNVPVHGRMDDPDFRLGGVIFQAIMGIFSKIATAPFSLLGAMFGGGDDLNYLSCPPGKVFPGPENQKKLETIITALKKRPKLRVFVSGLVHPLKDGQALEQDAFMRALKVEKYNAGKGSDSVVSDITIEPDEYATWLFGAYKAAPGDKPRKFGMIVKPETEDMEAFIRNTITVKEDDLLDLAVRRAREVQQYLLEKGGIAADRIFITSPKILKEQEQQDGMGVELSLGN